MNLIMQGYCLLHTSVSCLIDGEKWIFTNRQKTDTQSNIPLLPIAAEILNKYKNHLRCINGKSLLAFLNNQKMNNYLKEIADVCALLKNSPFTLPGTHSPLLL